MDNFMGKLKSGANKMAYEAEKVARSSRARSELEQLKNQVKAQYYKIGELYYQKRSTGVTGPEFDTLCHAVVDLEQQIKAKDEEIQKITAETFESQVGAAPQVQAPVTSGAPAAPATPPTPAPAVQAVQAAQAPVAPAPTAQAVQAAAPSSFPTQVNAPAQTKVCPSCGKEIPAGVKFCPECGKPV